MSTVLVDNAVVDALATSWVIVSTIAFVSNPLVSAVYSRVTKPMRGVMSTIALAGLARFVVGLDHESRDGVMFIDLAAAVLIAAQTVVSLRSIDWRERDRRMLGSVATVVAMLVADYFVTRQSSSAEHPSSMTWVLTVFGGALVAWNMWHLRFDIGRVPRPGRLGARTVSVTAFRAVADHAFSLLMQHDPHADRTRFDEGLDEMQVAVVLEDEFSGELRGFSLLHLQARRDVSGRPCTIVFAGDTVIARRFLGQGALQREWSRLLGRTKLRRPWRPLHWFLTCRDYRTYLLLVEHVRTAVPKYTIVRPSPALRTMLGYIAVDRYGDRFDPRTGIVRPLPGSNPAASAVEVPVITDELAQANPHVAYFLDRNPGYLQGDRLACIGDLTGRRVFQLWLLMTLRAPVRARRALAARAAD